jgi:ankyrin repeat protein
MLAVKYGREEVVRRFLNKLEKKDVDIQDQDGKTALMIAAESDRMKIFQLLLESGKADVNAQDKDGNTTLMYAITCGCLVTIQFLLESGKAEVNAQDKNGNTALMLAASFGHKEVVKLLLGKLEGKDINTQNRHCDTALKIATASGHMDIGRLLRGSGKVVVSAPADCNDQIPPRRPTEKNNGTMGEADNHNTEKNSSTRLSPNTHVSSIISEESNNNNNDNGNASNAGSTYTQIYSSLGIPSEVNPKNSVPNKQGHQPFLKSMQKGAISATIITVVTILTIAFTLGTFGLGIVPFALLCSGVLIANTMIGAAIGKAIDSYQKNDGPDIKINKPTPFHKGADPVVQYDSHSGITEDHAHASFQKLG